MELFDYLMAKKGHNTHRDLFSYLLGKNAGGSGTYTTFSGTSLNISNTLQAKIKNIALEGNTSQDGDPTPDTPIPIKVVTGEQNVKVQNKNLLNQETFEYGTTYGITKTNVENGKIALSGTSTQSSAAAVGITQSGIENAILLKKDVTYYFCANWSDDHTPSTSLLRMDIRPYNNLTQILAYETTQNGGSYTPSKDIYVRAFIRCPAHYTVPTNLTLEPIITTSTNTTFIEHQEQTYPLSLGNIELAKINDYKDYIFKNVVGSPYYNAELDLNGYYVCKNIGKVSLGSLSWSLYAQKIFYTQKTTTQIPNVLNENQRPYCVYFNRKSSVDYDDGIEFFSSNNHIEIRPNATFLSTYNSTTLFTQWLNDNNVFMYYILANATYEKITDTTLIQQLENINNARSYKGTTIIECTSESTDNETIVFSGDIKVTSVGNSLNTSLLSNNLQNEEPLSLDNTNEDEIEEPIEEYEEL